MNRKTATRINRSKVKLSSKICKGRSVITSRFLRSLRIKAGRGSLSTMNRISKLLKRKPQGIRSRRSLRTSKVSEKSWGVWMKGRSKPGRSQGASRLSQALITSIKARNSSKDCILRLNQLFSSILLQIQIMVRKEEGILTRLRTKMHIFLQNREE